MIVYGWFKATLVFLTTLGHIMAEPTEPPFTVQSAINWSLCVLCQEDTGDSL